MFRPPSWLAVSTVAYIVKAMTDCENMTTLRLSGNSLGVEATGAIAEVLTHTPTLQRALWSDMFVSRLKTEIPPALVCLQYTGPLPGKTLSKNVVACFNVVCTNNGRLPIE